MEAKISQLERKIAKQNNDNDILRNENYHLQTKLDAMRLDESKF
jgi:regulator of replication initiation timing